MKLKFWEKSNRAGIIPKLAPLANLPPKKRSNTLETSSKPIKKRHIPYKGRRNYDLANLDSAIGWNPVLSSGDGAIAGNINATRARTRDLYRNDDYCRAFVRTVISNVVGPKGIKFQARLKFAGGKKAGELDKVANSEIENLYKVSKKLKNKPIVDGKTSGRQAQAKWIRSLIVDGEVLELIHRGTTKNASRYASEFIDPDRLDHTLNEVRNGNRIKMGVEIDNQGEPVAYWILEDHPNEMLLPRNSRQRKRIPAEFIRHTFLEEQTGQTRGVSLLASAALRAHLIDQFEKATVIGGIVAARKVGFYKINQDQAEEYGILGNALEDTDDVCEDVNDDATMIHNVEDGQFEQLPSYVDGIESFSADYPPANFEEFEKRMIRGMAAGFGGQYHTIANDLEGVNFSSARAGELEQRKIWRQFQDLLIENMLEPDLEAWGEMTLLRNDVQFDRSKMRRLLDLDLYEFVSPGWAWVDPVKEMQANELALKLRLTTRKAIISESTGGEFEDVIDELSAEETYIESKGLTVIEDPKPGPDPKKSEDSEYD